MTAKTATKLRVASDNPAPAEAPATASVPSQPVVDELSTFRMEQAAVLSKVDADLANIAREKVAIEEAFDADRAARTDEHQRKMAALEEAFQREMVNKEAVHVCVIGQMDDRISRLHKVKAGAEAALKASEA